MTVFKNYFKIVKNYIILIIVFLSMSLAMLLLTTISSDNTAYTNIIPKIGVITNDTSEITNSLFSYLGKHAKVSAIENDEKIIQDKLYYNEVDLVIIIPKDFGKDVLQGKDVNMQIKKSAKNISSYSEVLINRFFKISKMYAISGLSEKEICNNIIEKLNFDTKVSKISSSTSESIKAVIFFDFLNYIYLSIFIFIIGTIMYIYNNDNISKRNIVSPTSATSFSLQLLSGHIVLTLIIWAISIFACTMICTNVMLSKKGVLLIISSLIFAFTTTSMAYLLSLFIKKKEAISGMQNVIALTLSFISGSFVPVEFLDKNILNMSKIFPSYWYINANNMIPKLDTINIDTLKPYLQNISIVFIFGLLFIILGLIVNKIKRGKQ